MSDFESAVLRVNWGSAFRTHTFRPGSMHVLWRELGLTGSNSTVPYVRTATRCVTVVHILVVDVLCVSVLLVHLACRTRAGQAIVVCTQPTF